ATGFGWWGRWRVLVPLKRVPGKREQRRRGGDPPPPHALPGVFFLFCPRLCLLSRTPVTCLNKPGAPPPSAPHPHIYKNPPWLPAVSSASSPVSLCALSRSPKLLADRRPNPACRPLCTEQEPKLLPTETQTADLKGLGEGVGPIILLQTSPSGPSPSQIRKLPACPAAAAGARGGKGGAGRRGRALEEDFRGGFPDDRLGEMVALVARQGRDLQRYTEDGHRLVVGCIPYKVESDKTGEHGIAIDRALQVLVISAQKGREMLFPRGGWESDESIKEATSREAMEEAGVLGDVEEELGRWWYQSKSHESRKVGIMFPLNVTEELHQWPEMGNRRRRWVTVAQARETCQQVWMLEALDILVERLSSSPRAHGTAPPLGSNIAEQPNRELGKMNSIDIDLMQGPAVPTSRKMEREPVRSTMNISQWILLLITSRMTLDVYLIPVNHTGDVVAVYMCGFRCTTTFFSQ
ncbi:hypothetical protein Taro_031872, partial [Colocasia esculenta]|nr:hypothetical protein [Colocasia esculenta]